MVLKSEEETDGSTSMTLYQIQYFRAVCTAGSITEAARLMHVSQPVVSAALKALEQELGVMLFYRYKRKLSITREGEKLLRHSEEIVVRLKALENRMSDLKNERRTVMVGVSPMVCGTYFPGLMREMEERYPEIKVEIEEKRSQNMIELLRKMNLDLAFALLSGDEPEDIGTMLLKRSQFQMAVSEEHALAAVKEISRHEMGEWPLVLYKNNQSMRNKFLKDGIELNVLIAVEQIYTMRSYALSGIAATLLLEDMIGPEKGLTGITVLPKLEANVGLMWKKSRNLHSNVITFMNFAKEYFEGRGTVR